MKRFFLLQFLLVMTAAMVMGQTVIAKRDADFSGYADIPQETIFLHFNSTLLFPAEYLYYKVYCINENGSGYSDISKVAYVELVSEDLNPVFRHKIQLIDGVGQGDFFIPTTIPSGNYKLIAYTNWMKNAGETNFFQNNIAVINPYQEDQTAILRPMMKKDSLTDTLEVFSEKIDRSPFEDVSNIGPLELVLDRKNLGKRAKGMFTINDTSGVDAIQGSYSVSVRKIDTLPLLPNLNAKNYMKIYNTSNRSPAHRIGARIFLPELRGELFSGEVLASKIGESTSNLDVAMSLPGEESRFRIAQTNTEGGFFMNMKADYNSEIAIMQIIGENGPHYSIRLNEPVPIDYSLLVFDKFKIDETMAHAILQRSVHNQIESAYFSFRPDSILPVQREMPFIENTMTSYHLDDYTPFKTVREALLEIIKNVWVRRTKSGLEEIEIKSRELESNPGLLPLAMIDGVIIQDQEALLNFDARRLNTIQVYEDRYIFGPEIYQGALLLTTKNNDYVKGLNNPIAKVFMILPPQPRKNYFVQNYDDPIASSHGNLPDDRLQLLWLPNAKLEAKTNQMHFFTSDVPGIYAISIEGFTNKGEAVSLREMFRVD